MRVNTPQRAVVFVRKTIGSVAMLGVAMLGTSGPAKMQAQSDRVAAAKTKPPLSTSSSFARAYSVPYSYSVAESISQASNGGFVVGALCSAGAVTTPNCNGPATVLRVDSSGNIQSQTQYSYGNGPQSTALNILKATSDGGAIFAGQPQSGCPAQNLSSCGAITKVTRPGQFNGPTTCYSPPMLLPTRLLRLRSPIFSRPLTEDLFS